MKNIKNFGQFVNESIKPEKNNESFTVSSEQMPSIGDIVDKVDWREGEKIAFIDFKGVKNIPVQVVDSEKYEVDEVSDV